MPLFAPNARPEARAFTLIELVVTFTVIAILSGIGALAIVQYRAGAQARAAQTDVALVAAGEQTVFLTRRAYLPFDDPALTDAAPSTDRPVTLVAGDASPRVGEVSVALAPGGSAFAVAAATGDGRCVVASARSGAPAHTVTSAGTGCAATGALPS